MPTTNFSDFTADELMGKTILNTAGGSGNSSRRLAKITHVTKTGFRISDSESLYSLDRGKKKGGGNARMDWGVYDNCELVTEDEANAFRKQWAENKEKKALYKTFENKLKISDLTLEQVKAIAEIINKP